MSCWKTLWVQLGQLRLPASSQATQDRLTHIQTCRMCYRRRHWFFIWNLLLSLFSFFFAVPSNISRVCAKEHPWILRYSAAVIAPRDWLCIWKRAVLGLSVSAAALRRVMYELAVPSRCSQQTLIYRLLLDFPFSLSWCLLPRGVEGTTKNSQIKPGAALIGVILIVRREALFFQVCRPMNYWSGLLWA